MFKRIKTAPYTSPRPRDVDLSPGLAFEAVLAHRSYRSEKIAWAIAICAIVLATISGSALLVMLPLKQTAAYVVTVDKNTGASQVVSAVDARQITNNEVNAQYWMARYVSARESYLYKILQSDYDVVMALSSQNVGAAYSAQFEGPNSKATKFGDSAEDRIRIISVQPTPGQYGRGTVRFEKTSWNSARQPTRPAEVFQADLAFEWLNITGWDTRDLLINPLGFSVSAYRVTPELVQPSQPEAGSK